MPDTAVGHFYLYIKLCTLIRSGEPCLPSVLCVNAKKIYIKNISKVILILITQNHLPTNAD